MRRYFYSVPSRSGTGRAWAIRAKSLHRPRAEPWSVRKPELPDREKLKLRLRLANSPSPVISPPVTVHRKEEFR